MSADDRLFAYALEPQLQRLRWRHDEQVAELAAALAEAQRLRAQAATLARETADIAGALARAQASRMDPARARLSLDYLAALHRRHATAEQETAAADRRGADLRAALAATQAQVEGLERDRADRLAEHLVEAGRRTQRDADQDWMARAAWQSRGAAREELPQ
jgi:hypothetical protein